MQFHTSLEFVKRETVDPKTIEAETDVSDFIDFQELFHAMIMGYINMIELGLTKMPQTSLAPQQNERRTQTCVCDRNHEGIYIRIDKFLVIALFFYYSV